MSDSTDNPPPRKDAAGEDETGDFQDPSGEISGHALVFARVFAPWVSAWRRRAGAWTSAFLSGKAGREDHLYRTTVLMVMERLSGIGSGLIALIMVDHHYGPVGLGIFAWFFSLLAITGYLGRYGIPTYVENHTARSAGTIADTVGSALGALMLLGGVAVFLSMLGAFVAADSGPDAGGTLLVLLVGPTIFFQNINALRLAMLNGKGRHGTVAGLRIRQRVVFLAATLLLCLIHVPVPLLAGGFLISQMIILPMGRRTARLPGISSILAGRKDVFKVMDQGQRFLFSDNFLDVVFYLDMLILGWFADPAQLGVYARVLILARLFLVIPAGFRPVVRRLANEWVHAGHVGRLQRFMAGSTRCLFVAHGLLAILVMVHFPRVMMMIFDIRQWSNETFAVFSMLLPGLIFFSAVTAMEPVFEARDQTRPLKRLTLTAALANLVLNINLIPFAGLKGAALATASAMLIHFLLFGRLLPDDLSGAAFPWLPAAAALYLAYVLMASVPMGTALSLLLAPVLFGALLWMAGFFHPTSAKSHSGNVLVRMP